MNSKIVGSPSSAYANEEVGGILRFGFGSVFHSSLGDSFVLAWGSFFFAAGLAYSLLDSLVFL